MPRTYTRRFRVRSTDCDAVGHVNHAVFLRYMQETAIEASADAGYDSAWYDETGTGWVIRRSRIDYLHPIRHGDAIDVNTYVVNVRRVRSQRNYDITRVGDGMPIARAATDWVFIDRRTGAPKRIPDDAPARFMPDGPDPNVDLILDLPSPPDAPPSDAFHIARRVYFYEMDEYQHVNNAVYLSYLEQAAIDAGVSLGFDAPRLFEWGGLFVVHQHDIEYLHPAQYGDTLDIATWLGQVARSSVVRHTTMRIQGGELSIRAQTRWVWIDLARRESTPMPAILLEALQGHSVALGSEVEQGEG
jgi:acyl-CoA thioester hydrolase